MNYQAQLSNLTDDDGDDDATVIMESPRYRAFAQGRTVTVIEEAPEIVIDLLRRVKPAVSQAGTELPQQWERHFWVNPGATSAPVSIAWKGEEGRAATTQRIVLRRDSSSWRSPSTWKSRLAALAMLSFLVSAVAAIALMTHA